MKNILAEGFEFVYDNDFYHGLDFYGHFLEKTEIYFAEDAIKYVSIEDLAKVCRICITFDKIRDVRDVVYIDYLYWLDKLDLVALDEKVEKGNYTDIDFQSAIKTYYVNKVLCFGCNNTFKALCVERIPLYPTNFSLGEKKRELLKNNNGIIKNCPICSKKFTLTVVHIFT